MKLFFRKWPWSKRGNREEVQEELQFHLEEEAEQLQAQGLTKDAALLAARRDFGNETLVKEEIREVWHWVWLERLAQDLRYGVRLFMKTPGFTLIVILTLALGIGANTAIFSMVHSVLLRPLPYQAPEQLVAIWQSAIREKGSKLFASYQDFENWRDNSNSFSNIAGVTWAVDSQILTGYGAPKTVLAIPATIGLFSLLDVSPALGHTFYEEDLSRGCTVVLAHQFWRSLGGNVNVAGGTIDLGGQSCTVIGVMPPGFVFYPEKTALWTLITPNSKISRKPDQAGIAVFARLKSGVSIKQAQTEARILANRIDNGTRYGAKMEPVVYPLANEFVWMAGRNLRLSLLVLFAAVGLVLLIGCVNVSNLLLGRTLVRQREMTIRAALGSTQSRLFRQLLTEHLLLSLVSAVVGIALAAAAVHYFRANNPVELPPGSSVSLDIPVLAFTGILALLTTALFGLLPAWKVSRVDLNEDLKAGGRNSGTMRTRRLAKNLIVIEVALSIVLLVGAGLLIQSVQQFSAAPLGFQSSRLFVLPLNLPPRQYQKAEQRGALYREVTDALHSLTGLQGAVLSSAIPLRGSGGFDALVVEGRPVPTSDTAIHDIAQQAISDGYVRFMGLSLRRGREFDSRDSADSPRVAIINEALAHKYFLAEDPIGKHIRIVGEANNWLTIIGVTADEKRTIVYQEMGWIDSPIVYRPYAQQAPASAYVLVRSGDHQTEFGISVQRSIMKLNPSVSIGEPEAIHDVMAEYLRYPEFRATLLATFAAIALFLSAIGLYGVLSQLVVQRTKEIGLRMALGAQQGTVLAMIAKEGMLLAGLGVGLGLLMALFLGRVINILLYGVSSADPATLAGVSVVLLATALLATYIPARRAATVDPLIALGHE